MGSYIRHAAANLPRAARPQPDVQAQQPAARAQRPRSQGPANSGDDEGI